MLEKVAVVTGSNSGLGYAIVKRLCRRFRGVVYLTSLDIALAEEAVARLKKHRLYPRYHQLDISNRESITNFRDLIVQKHGGIDILINNAGIRSNALTKNSYEKDKQVIDINFRSMLIIQELIFPIIRENGRILYIASNTGHLSNLKNKYWLKRLSAEDLKSEDINEFVDWYLVSSKNKTINKTDFIDETILAYKVSKIAVCALTRIHQKQLKHRNISVNALHPGLMRTPMSYGFGILSTEQASKTPVYVVLDAPQSLQGEFIWFNGRVVDWCDDTQDTYYSASLFLKNIVVYSIFKATKHYIAKTFSNIYY